MEWEAPVNQEPVTGRPPLLSTTLSPLHTLFDNLMMNSCFSLGIPQARSVSSRSKQRLKRSFLHSAVTKHTRSCEQTILQTILHCGFHGFLFSLLATSRLQIWGFVWGSIWPTGVLMSLSLVLASQKRVWGLGKQ